MAKHPAAEMVFTGRWAKKHAVSSRRGPTEWNWWYNGYKCPVCGATRKRLANLDTRNNNIGKPMCSGSKESQQAGLTPAP